MDSVKFVWLLNSFLLCFSINTDSKEYIFPLFIPAVNENLPNILFLNEGEVVGVANVSIPAVGTDESVVVSTQTTFVLYDALRSSDLNNDAAITIHIRTSDKIRPYISLQPSQPSIAIQPVSSVGKEYHLYDTRGYNLDSYCLDILSLHNNTQVQVTTDIKQGAVGSDRPTNFTMDEFEINRICTIAAIHRTHVESTNPVVLILSGDYKTTGTQNIIDMIVAYSHWGQTFIAYPLLDEQQYRTCVRIFSLKGDSTVHYRNSQIIINADDYVDVEIIQPLKLASDAPVYVTLSVFDKSSFYNVSNEIDVSNPILTTPVMPIEQYISRTYIQTATGSNTSRATISTICSGLSHITFDGEALDVKPDVEITSITDSTYCLITVQLKPEARHEICSYLQTATFTVMVNVTNVNTNYVYNVGGSDKALNCKTLIYGHLTYEHYCDVKVYEKNTSCSGPPLTCYVEKSECTFCIRLNGMIALGAGSALATVALSMFCQIWYCPRSRRNKDLKMAKKMMKEKEEARERKERERFKNAEIRIERRLIELRTVVKPRDNTQFYNLIAGLKGGAAEMQ